MLETLVQCHSPLAVHPILIPLPGAPFSAHPHPPKELPSCYHPFRLQEGRPASGSHSSPNTDHQSSIVQVHKLRQEKDVLEGKLKEFERSLQKLKDCTYQEATQKREYERRVQAAQADLRGAHLREQVLLFFTPGLPQGTQASVIRTNGV